MGKAKRWVIRPVAEWDAIFEAQKASHQTAARYCREQGIDYKQFLYLRKKDQRRQSTQSLMIAGSAGIASTVRQRGFMKVMVEKSCGIRLRFPRGLVVESDSLLPAMWVTEVARRWICEGNEPC